MGLDDYLVASNRRLAIFVGVLFLVPIALIVTRIALHTAPMTTEAPSPAEAVRDVGTIAT